MPRAAPGSTPSQPRRRSRAGRRIRSRTGAGHGGGVLDAKWQLIGMIVDNQDPCNAIRIEFALRSLSDWKSLTRHPTTAAPTARGGRFRQPGCADIQAGRDITTSLCSSGCDPRPLLVTALPGRHTRSRLDATAIVWAGQGRRRAAHPARDRSLLDVGDSPGSIERANCFSDIFDREEGECPRAPAHREFDARGLLTARISADTACAGVGTSFADPAPIGGERGTPLTSPRQGRLRALKRRVKVVRRSTWLRAAAIELAAQRQPAARPPTRASTPSRASEPTRSA